LQLFAIKQSEREMTYKTITIYNQLILKLEKKKIITEKKRKKERALSQFFHYFLEPSHNIHQFEHNSI